VARLLPAGTSLRDLGEPGASGVPQLGPEGAAAFAEAFQAMFIAAGGLALVILLIALTLKQLPLRHR
jgi:hypothetical protein